MLFCNRLKLKCVKCGKETEEPKDSMKHPYCKVCFKKEFTNDISEYRKWLSNTHI